MIKSTIELIKLTATDGMTLTNGEVYSKEVYLGCNDSPANWHEITDAEAERLQAELLQVEMEKTGEDAQQQYDL